MSDEKRWPCDKCGRKIISGRGGWVAKPALGVMVWMCNDCWRSER